MVLTIALGLVGLVLGSFGEVLTTRLPKRAGWVGGRSKCDSCQHELGVWDLIPVLSYLLQKGKCRYCNQSIGWQVWLTELTMGLGFGLIGWLVSNNAVISGIGLLGWGSKEEILRGILILSSFFCLSVIFWVDLRQQIIADEMLVILGIISTGILSFVDWLSWTERLIATGFGSGVFGLLFIITKGKGIGWGDVKLGGIMGILLGKFLIIALYVAFVSGSLTALVLMALKKRGRKSKIALGPFLVGGVWIAWIFGGEIWNWYLGLLL